MSTIAEQLAGTGLIADCDLFRTAGSLLLVGNLPGCTSLQPFTNQVTVNEIAGLTGTETEVSLFANQLFSGQASATLREGMKLTFSGGSTAIVAATTTITATAAPGNPVPLVPGSLSGAVADAETVDFWELFCLERVTDDTQNYAVNSVESTNHKGGNQFSMADTGIELTMNVSYDLSRQDEAFFRVVRQANLDQSIIFAYLYAAGGLRTFGPAFARPQSISGAIKEIRRASMILAFQPRWYFGGPLNRVTDANQLALIQQLDRLAGLDVIE